MTQSDPPEFEPDDAPALGSRRGAAPGAEPEPEPDDDLIRCSRFLDDDLDLEDKLAFEQDLVVYDHLRHVLADLRVVREQVRSPIEPSDAELDAVLVSVWARLDDGVAPGDGPMNTALASHRPAAVVDGPHHRARRPLRRTRTWAPLLQWSAAAAVVVAIAVVAVSGGSGDDNSSEDGERTSVALEQQRSAGATIGQEVRSGVQDAMSASTRAATGNKTIDLGSFSDISGLLDALSAGPATAEVPGATEASGDPDRDGGVAASPTAAALTCTSDPPGPTGHVALSGVATVAGAPVLWTLWESAEGQWIIVQHAGSCATLADQPI